MFYPEHKILIFQTIFQDNTYITTYFFNRYLGEHVTSKNKQKKSIKHDYCYLLFSDDIKFVLYLFSPYLDYMVLI